MSGFAHCGNLDGSIVESLLMSNIVIKLCKGKLVEKVITKSYNNKSKEMKVAAVQSVLM